MRNYPRRLTQGVGALLLIALACLPSMVWAGGRCCAECGCTSGCRKVCRLVEEEKKVEVICWGAKCEEFCLPGCSKEGCQHCETVCSTCDKTADGEVVKSKPKKFLWSDWTPHCAKPHAKTKLMKKVVIKKIPSYKWVIEDLCPECRK